MGEIWTVLRPLAFFASPFIPLGLIGIAQMVWK